MTSAIKTIQAALAPLKGINEASLNLARMASEITGPDDNPTIAEFRSLSQRIVKDVEELRAAEKQFVNSLAVAVGDVMKLQNLIQEVRSNG